jgi:hypothetical protein
MEKDTDTDTARLRVRPGALASSHRKRAALRAVLVGHGRAGRALTWLLLGSAALYLALTWLVSGGQAEPAQESAERMRAKKGERKMN